MLDISFDVPDRFAKVLGSLVLIFPTCAANVFDCVRKMEREVPRFEEVDDLDAACRVVRRMIYRIVRRNPDRFFPKDAGLIQLCVFHVLPPSLCPPALDTTRHTDSDCSRGSGTCHRA